MNECKVEKGKIEPCDSLALTFKTGIDSSPGVEFCALKHDGEKEIACNFVVLKSGKFKIKGVVLQHCPFCRTDISSHLPEPG